VPWLGWGDDKDYRKRALHPLCRAQRHVLIEIDNNPPSQKMEELSCGIEYGCE